MRESTCSVRIAGSTPPVIYTKRGLLSLEQKKFKLESIKEHEKSQGHLQCTRIAAAKRAPPNSSPAGKALCSLHQAQKENGQIVQNSTCHCQERETIHGLCLDVRAR